MAVAPKKNGLDVLRKLVPLNTLGEGELSHLLQAVVFEKLKPGEYLFRAGDTDNQNIYLLSGQVALLADRDEVDSVLAGSDTARFPLAHQVPRKLSAVSRSKVELVRVDNRMLGELLVSSEAAGDDLADTDPAVPDDWMSQLLRFRAFQQIPPSNIQRVIMAMKEIELDQGEVVFHQGARGDYFYLLNKGFCAVSRSVGGRAAEDIAKLGPGDSFGEEALLSDAPRMGTVTMLTNGVLLRLNKADFIELVKEPLARELLPVEAKSEIERGALWLDVRPSAAFDTWHMPDSISLPMASLRYQSSSLDPDRAYIVYCENGQQSATAAFLLFEQGFSVAVLQGGLEAMQADGTVANAGPVLSVAAATQKPVVANTGIERQDDRGSSRPASESQSPARSQGSDKFKQALAETIKKLALGQQRLAESEARERLLRARCDSLEVTLDSAKRRIGELELRITELGAGSVIDNRMR